MRSHLYPRQAIVIVIAAIGGLALWSLTSCATIISKSTYPVTFDSFPSGANVVVSDHTGRVLYDGKTPNTLQLDAGKGYFSGASYTVTVAKDGYKSHTAVISSSIDGWYWLNLLVGGVIGMLIVDPISGAMFKLEDTYLANLVADGSNAGLLDVDNGTVPLLADSRRLTVITTDELPEAWRHALIRIG